MSIRTGSNKHTYKKKVHADAIVEEDAARWRAFIGSARIRMLGSAGLNGDRDGYAHLGLEIWTKHPGDCTADNKLAREWLIKYTDIAMG